jgi:DNA segregation ATPase FtsK/SpoIIIE-like protein
LLLGKGDFVVVARGEQMRVQGPYASSQQVRRVVTRLLQGRTGQRPADTSAPREWTQQLLNVTRRLATVLPSVEGASQQTVF